MHYPANLEKRLAHILSNINNAATKTGRNPNNIHIIAVTKSFPPETWQKAFDVNLNIIGESRVQEAQLKLQKFSTTKQMQLHLIGHLQSNKANKAVELFDVIQTVDSIKLAKRINAAARKRHQKQNIFIQINASADPKKYGFLIEEALISSKIISKMEYIKLLGIMTIPAQNLTSKELKKTYCQTRKIRDTIKNNINNTCKNLSMGMSNDYTVAVSEGATHIRLGTALFGTRNK